MLISPIWEMTKPKGFCWVVSFVPVAIRFFFLLSETTKTKNKKQKSKNQKQKIKNKKSKTKNQKQKTKNKKQKPKTKTKNQKLKTKNLTSTHTRWKMLFKCFRSILPGEANIRLPVSVPPRITMALSPN